MGTRNPTSLSRVLKRGKQTSVSREVRTRYPEKVCPGGQGNEDKKSRKCLHWVIRKILAKVCLGNGDKKFIKSALTRNVAKVYLEYCGQEIQLKYALGNEDKESRKLSLENCGQGIKQMSVLCNEGKESSKSALGSGNKKSSKYLLLIMRKKNPINV